MLLQEAKKKDPDAPKKPLTAYMVWLQENRAAIKDKHPGISLIDIAKKAGEMWKEVADKSVRAWALGKGGGVNRTWEMLEEGRRFTVCVCVCVCVWL